MTAAGDWFTRGVRSLRAGKSAKSETNQPPALVNTAQAAIDLIATGAPTPETPVKRNTHERLAATLRREAEALSPRVLRRTWVDLKAIVDPRVSEVEGGRRAKALAQWYASASHEERLDTWLLMSEQFMSDPQVLARAQARLEKAVGTADEAEAQVQYRRDTVSPRRRLLQRFSAYPGGIRFLVDMRADAKADKRLRALDVEMEYMFSTWFDVGFLDLRPISWDSPASLLEKLIQYEAVHDIKSWADLKNRLDSDRRCYGFFHPRLPDEPLIFVEVALQSGMAHSITPLLDETAAPVDVKKASTAIFYSISNTQSGLRGVSFGDSLIKRVVETLKAEFPRLTTFATLSPIPGFRNWWAKNAVGLMAQLSERDRAALLAVLPAAASSETDMQRLTTAAEHVQNLQETDPLRQFMLRCAAHYLGKAWQADKPLDPVARFHLGNGARVECLNWAGDPSAKGQRQSYGLMVNYLYDLKRLDKHRDLLAQGKVPMSAALEALYFQHGS